MTQTKQGSQSFLLPGQAGWPWLTPALFVASDACQQVLVCGQISVAEVVLYLTADLGSFVSLPHSLPWVNLDFIEADSSNFM